MDCDLQAYSSATDMSYTPAVPKQSRKKGGGEYNTRRLQNMLHKQNETPKTGLCHKYMNQQHHVRAKKMTGSKVSSPLHGRTKYTFRCKWGYHFPFYEFTFMQCYVSWTNYSDGYFSHDELSAPHRVGGENEEERKNTEEVQ